MGGMPSPHLRSSVQRTTHQIKIRGNAIGPLCRRDLWHDGRTNFGPENLAISAGALGGPATSAERCPQLECRIESEIGTHNTLTRRVHPTACATTPGRSHQLEGGSGGLHPMRSSAVSGYRSARNSSIVRDTLRCDDGRVTLVTLLVFLVISNLT